MLEIIQKIIADVTKNPISAISESSSNTNVDGWDSVAQINIIVSIEMEFGVSFSADQMYSLNSVRQIIDELTMQVAA